MTTAMIDDQGTWVSIAELARLHNVSKQAVSKRVKAFVADGKLQVRPVGRQRHVDAVVYARLVQDTTDPAQALRNGGGDVPASDLFSSADTDPATPETTAPGQKVSFNDAKARKATIDAEVARLDYEERLGQLMDRQESEDQHFANVRRIRDRLMALPATCSDALASAPDARAIRVMLTEEIRKVLESVADELAEEFADDDGS